EALVPASLLAEEGTATVTVVRDDGTSAGLTFTITDAALGSLTISNPPASEEVGFSGFTVATFTDANAGAPATDFTATVTCGAGTAATVSGAGGGIVALGGGQFAVRASHTYAEGGTFSLSVAVLDVGGASLSGSQKVSVADAPLSGLTITAIRATEGKHT